jgi:hypothetical protein
MHLIRPPLLFLGLAVISIGGCASLSHSVIPLDVPMTDDAAQVAVLSDHSRHPVLLRGVDQKPVSAIRIPNAFRDTIYLLSPGLHVLWVSSVPYGHPLLPQTVRCYVLSAHFERGARYVLEEDPDNEHVRMLREGSALPAASGQLVDKAPVFLRDCRWQ